MASSPGTAAFLADQLGPPGEVVAKKMFGEYSLYLEGRLFALLCNDRLYFKPTAASADYLPAPEMAPPYPSAKPCIVIPAERWEDREWLAAFARATALSLPLPKPKAKKKTAP